MLLKNKQLKNLPVYSKSNDMLGKIKDIEIDSHTHSIRNYIVKSGQVAKRLAGEELLISPSQVISIDNQKMIVEDDIIKDEGILKEAASI